jgi:hypothetical protein
LSGLALPLPGFERGRAVFSPCGQYRYELHRPAWGPGPRLLAIGANPSYAGADVDDHTVRKIIGFAKRWGFGALSLANAFAFVSTDPAGLYSAADPVGPENDAHIREMARIWPNVFGAWGAIGGYRNRDVEVMRILADAGCEPFCIGTTATGFPRHPSRPGYVTPRAPYRGRTAA